MSQSTTQRASAPETSDAEKPGNRPVNTIRFGGVEATIWSNQSDKGEFYNITFQRRYQDKNQQWQTAQSYGANDALALAKVADLAVTTIIELQEEKRQGRA
jgi:hypothetical protein